MNFEETILKGNRGVKVDVFIPSGFDTDTVN